MSGSGANPPSVGASSKVLLRAFHRGYRMGYQQGIMDVVADVFLKFRQAIRDDKEVP